VPPVPSGTRYRFKKLASGKKVRLAFAPDSNKVLEVKSYSNVMKENRKKRGARR
jgi:hypothetical protein